MRFRLSTLMLCVTGLAVYLGVAFTLPVTASYYCLSLVTVLALPVLITGVVYARGYARTFWIGCISSSYIPLLAQLGLGGGVFLPIYLVGDIAEERIYAFLMVISHAVVLTSGAVAVAARWVFERQAGGSRADYGKASTPILRGRVTVADMQSLEVEHE